jgi:two-component system sensor histidine kinase CpxA
MVSALDRMMTAQQRLLSDISHELRTPLTRLQLGTALLRRRSGEAKSWSASKPKRTVWTA